MRWTGWRLIEQPQLWGIIAQTEGILFWEKNSGVWHWSWDLWRHNSVWAAEIGAVVIQANLFPPLGNLVQCVTPLHMTVSTLALYAGVEVPFRGKLCPQPISLLFLWGDSYLSLSVSAYLFLSLPFPPSGTSPFFGSLSMSHLQFVLTLPRYPLHLIITGTCRCHLEWVSRWWDGV